MATQPSAAKGTPQRLGRFELQRVLGRGAQATVWLAHDTRLDREVAVKLLASDADAVAISQWLHEARAVSRLTHPNIVPVFEADQQEGQSYLVFEYVKGPTLTEMLRQRGALPAREAVGLILGVLDALREAHEGGIVHRDLKPSNILIDGDGRARVMDFGIAARVADKRDLRICGTPGYMSPEAARGEAPAPTMDVFAAGVLLTEMLSGKPLLRESDPMRAITRVIEEDMVLPEDLGASSDDALRALLARAIVRDPAKRFASAEEFHRALSRWLQPEPLGESAGASGTLEFLLRRMRHKSDFPAMSDAVSRIQRVTESENEKLSSLANEILKDVALTNKLLRCVNSAHYAAAGGKVNTVSRAVALVGFAGIRNMALSLILLERMQDKAHAGQLKDEFLRALMAGTLAGELTPLTSEGEEAFLGAMFQNLGRMLTEFYFPEEARRIQDLLRSGRTDAEALPAQLEDTAAASVLGISFEELGLGVARHWGLPDSLQQAMRRASPDVTSRAQPAGIERLRRLGVMANELTTAMLSEGDPAERLAEIGKRHARALNLDESQLAGTIGQARQRLSSLAQALNLNTGASPAMRRLMATVEPRTQVDDLTVLELHADAAAPEVDEAQTVATSPQQVAGILSDGIQDVTNHMVQEGFKLNEVLRMILETMFRALAFRRVVFCLRDPKTELLTGRLGLGEQADAVRLAFKVPVRPPAGAAVDLFTAVCMKGVDTLITDATVPNIAARLPGWYRSQVNAPAFLLLPLMMKNAPFALIYADKAKPGGIELGEKELSLLRTLRNQAVMAFRQSV